MIRASIHEIARIARESADALDEFGNNNWRVLQERPPLLIECLPKPRIIFGFDETPTTLSYLGQTGWRFFANGVQSKFIDDVEVLVLTTNPNPTIKVPFVTTVEA